MKSSTRHGQTAHRKVKLPLCELMNPKASHGAWSLMATLRASKSNSSGRVDIGQELLGSCTTGSKRSIVNWTKEAVSIFGLGVWKKKLGPERTRNSYELPQYRRAKTIEVPLRVINAKEMSPAQKRLFAMLLADLNGTMVGTKVSVMAARMGFDGPRAEKSFMDLLRSIRPLLIGMGPNDTLTHLRRLELYPKHDDEEVDRAVREIGAGRQRSKVRAKNDPVRCTQTTRFFAPRIYETDETGPPESEDKTAGWSEEGLSVSPATWRLGRFKTPQEDPVPVAASVPVRARKTGRDRVLARMTAKLADIEGRRHELAAGDDSGVRGDEGSEVGQSARGVDGADGGGRAVAVGADGDVGSGSPQGRTGARGGEVAGRRVGSDQRGGPNGVGGDDDDRHGGGDPGTRTGTSACTGEGVGTVEESGGPVPEERSDGASTGRSCRGVAELMVT